MNVPLAQTGLRRILALSIGAIVTAVALLYSPFIQAQSVEEDWTAASDYYTNNANWNPPLTLSLNGPNNNDGTGNSYNAAITNGGTCLYGGSDPAWTNTIGALWLGGVANGIGGSSNPNGSVSNVFLMSGGSLMLADPLGNDFSIGGNSTGTGAIPSTNFFTMTGGTLDATVSSGINWIAASPGSVATAEFDGGMASFNILDIGGRGNATVNVNGGNVIVGSGANYQCGIGWGAATGVGSGALNIISGTVTATNRSGRTVFIGNQGANNVLNVSGGTLNTSGVSFGGGTSSANVTNTFLFSGGVINMSSGGVGRNGANDKNRAFFSGGTFSTLPQSANPNWSWSSLVPITLTNSPGSGVLTFAPAAGTSIEFDPVMSGNGGINAAGPGMVILGALETFTGGTAVSGGTLAVNVAQTQNLNFNITGGNLQINDSGALVDSAISLGGASTLVFSNTLAKVFTNVLSGSGGLMLGGGGNITIPNAGNLGYTGNTIVNAGTLLLTGTGSISSSTTTVAVGGTLDVSSLSPFSLGSGQTLAGNGKVAAATVNLNSGSTLAAGLSASNVDTLTMSGNLVFNTGSTNSVAVMRAAIVLGNDRVAGLNSVKLGGTLVITNIGTSPFAPGDAVPLFSAATYNANGFTSANIIPATPGSGLVWDTSTLGSDGTLRVASSGGNPNAPQITTQPVSAAVNQGDAFTNKVVATGSGPLFYQWYQYPSGVPVDGATNATLELNPVLPSNATNYVVVVTNSFGSVVSSVVSVTVNTTPVITSESPVTYTNLFKLYAGVSPAFSISAVGAQPISYQWYTNGVLDSAATSSNFVWTNVQVGTITNYCVLANAAGSVTSSVWTASVLAVPSAPYPAAVLSSGPIGYWRLSEPDNGDGVDNGNDGAVSLDYVGGNDGLYTNTVLSQPGYTANDTPNSDSTETSALFGQNNLSFFDSFAGQIGNVDFSAPINTSATFSVEAWVNGGHPVIGVQTVTNGAAIVCKGYGNGGEQFDLDVFGPGIRFLVRDASGTAHSAVSTFSPALDTWHHLVGVCDEANAKMSLYIDGILAASATIPSGSGILASVNPMTIGAKKSSATTNSYNLQFVGRINDVAIYNYALSSNQVSGQYTAAGVAPYFTQQPPASTNVSEGGILTIPTAVIGTGPISYQWYFFPGGNPIAGQTNATLVVTNVNAVTYDGATLYVTATGSYGSISSSQVSISVLSGFNVQNLVPASFTAYAGETVTYTIAASGTVPFYYQWLTNGVIVPGATASTYTPVVPLGSLSISCTVSNAYNGGSFTTVGPVTLTGVTAPTDPYPAAVLGNNPVAFWRLDEPDDGLNDGNSTVIAHEYVGGHNGAYTNVELGLPGYNASADPDTAAGVGILTTSNSRIGEIDNSANGTPTIDFSKPPGSDAELSVEAWVKASASSSGPVVCKGHGNGGEQFGLDIVNAGDFRFFVRDASGTAHNFTSSVIPVIGQWYHLVGVFDGSNGMAHLYINGVDSINASNIPTGLGLLATTNANPLMPQAELVNIGARNSGINITSFNLQFQGTIDDVALYNYALSQAQVTAHYQAGTAGAVSTSPVNLAFSVSGNQLTLSWPADHTGWRLQAQTNGLSAGLNNNWFDVNPSTNVNQVIVPISQTNGSVFYRLVYP